MLCMQFADAQVNIYTFSSSVETFTPITGGTILGTSTNNNESFNSLPIGFFFNYLGEDFTEVSVNTDGFLAFGGTVSTSFTCLSTGPSNNVVSALNLNIVGISGSGEMMYLTEGELPNRTFTMQWLNFQYSGATGNGDNFNFQIKLYENGNKIEFHYGNFLKNATNRTAQVGLRGASNADVINRSVITGTNTWETSVPGTINTASCALATTNLPTDGLVYTWAIVEQTYQSSTVEQVTGYVLQGSTDQAIINIKVVMEGALVPLNLTSLTFNTNGSTNPLVDLTDARVYYTGNSNVFSTEVQFGEVVENPNGSFEISGNQELLPQTNNFWLTYSISEDATSLNEVDAECTEITVDGFNYTPTITAPTGSRIIRIPFNGTYTIGEGGTYPDLYSAFNDVNSLGLGGNTTFEIISDIVETSPAILNEWYEIGLGGYYLTIKPSNVMRTIEGNLNNGVIVLNGADRVSIDGRIDGEGNFLTIQNNNTGSTSAAIRLISLGNEQGCENVKIKNCNINGASPIFTTSFAILVGGTTFSASSSGAHNHNLSIMDNVITRAYYGIFVRGVATTGLSENILIEGNEIGSTDTDLRIGLCGIDIQNIINSTINKNHIHSLYNPNSFVINGILVRGNFANSVISNNIIHDIKLKGASSIFMPSITGPNGIDVQSNGTKYTIVNNVIYDISSDNNKTTAGTFTPFGICIRGGDSAKIYFNSVNIYGEPPFPCNGGTRSAALAIMGNSNTNMDIRNNSFSNSFEGIIGSESYSIYTENASSSFYNINNNNYYSSGPYAIFGYLGIMKLNLQEWQEATGMDQNSSSYPPLYTADDNLFPLYSSPLIFAGNQLDEFPNDILGTERYVKPTIGAYEYVSDGNMSYLLSNTEQYNFNPIMIGNSNQEIILVKIVTRGTDNPLELNSISFNMNGTTNPQNDISEIKVFYTGAAHYFSTETQYGQTLSPTDDFTVTGNLELLPGANYFWLTYSSSPDAINMDFADAECTGFEINEVIYVPTITAPEGRRQLRTYFSGTYTVGEGGLYSSFYQAFNDIEFLGLSGNTTLLVVSNVVEPYPAVLNQWTEIGAGNYNLTIKPDQSFQTIEGNLSNNGVLVLNGVDRVTIDGRINELGNNLMIKNNNSTSISSAIRIVSLGEDMGCDDILIRNCIISGGSADYSSSYALTIGGTSYLASNGASNNNISIIENNFVSAYWGIVAKGVQTTGYNQNLIIKSNTIGSTVPSQRINLRGINIENCPGALITENHIHNFNASTYSYIAGIEIGTGCYDAVISKNKINSLYELNNYGVNGILISNGTNTSNVNIVNNIIYDLKTPNYSETNLTSNPFGIRIQSGIDHKIYYNSVNLFGEQIPTGTSGTLSAALMINNTNPAPTGLDIRNNVFANSLTGLTGSNSYAIYSQVPAVNFTSIDYNDYYASGTYGVLGFLGSNINTLLEWQTATGLDGNSLSSDPMYEEDYPLYIDIISPVIGEGIYLDSYTDDFLGNSRLTIPSIGAYEYYDNIILAPPMLVSPENNAIEITIINDFTWEENLDAEYYRIQIATDIDFSNVIFDDNYIYETNWSNYYPLTHSTLYYWRVQCVADGKLSTWSEAWSFTTIAPLDSPQLLSPLNESTGNLIIPSFSWTAVDFADSYSLELSLDADFNNIVYSITTSQTSFLSSIELEYETTYYWRVKAFNLEGNFSQWSEVWSFITINAPAVPWVVVTETGNSSTIFVPLNCDISIEGREISINDAIGLFYQVIPGVWACGGYGLWNNESLGIIVWGDNPNTTIKDGFAIGEPFTFRIWDGVEEVEYPAVATFSLGPTSYEMSGFSMLESLTTDLNQTQNINLNNGWNTISSYITPQNPSMPNVFSSILTSVRIVKNNFGQMYVPEWGLNSIGNWNVNHGYQINVYAPTQLPITGVPIQPEFHQINMNNGWNLTSYLRNNPMSPVTALNSITSSLILVKDGSGGIYSPIFGINTIGNMQSGKGYFFYLNSNAVLTYPANSSQKVNFNDKITPLSRYLIPSVKNTGNDASLILNCEEFQDGNEIGVYNMNNNLIGSGTVNNGIAAITIWGDNEITENIDGALQDEYLTLKLYNTISDKYQEISLININEITGGENYRNLHYKSNAIYNAKAVLSNEKMNSLNIVNLPNPVSSATVFEFNLISEGNAEICIYSMNGELISKIASDYFSAGIHRVDFYSGNLPNGFYNVMLRCGLETATTKMLIQK